MTIPKKRKMKAIIKPIAVFVWAMMLFLGSICYSLIGLLYLAYIIFIEPFTTKRT